MFNFWQRAAACEVATLLARITQTLKYLPARCLRGRWRVVREKFGGGVLSQIYFLPSGLKISPANTNPTYTRPGPYIYIKPTATGGIGQGTAPRPLPHTLPPPSPDPFSSVWPISRLASGSVLTLITSQLRDRERTAAGSTSTPMCACYLNVCNLQPHVRLHQSIALFMWPANGGPNPSTSCMDYLELFLSQNISGANGLVVATCSPVVL